MRLNPTRLTHRVLGRLFGTAEEITGNHRCPTYLYRWVLGSIGPVKMYLHHFVGADWSRDLHDHPKRFITIGLSGSYLEQTPDGIRRYGAPWARSFPAAHRHRISVAEEGAECWTLVLVGPTQREWGFWSRGRFTPWAAYVFGPLGDAAKACV